MTEPTRPLPASASQRSRSPRKRSPPVGDVSRPSVNAWTTRSGTPRSAPMRMRASTCLGPECTPPSDTSPMRWTRSAPANARAQDLVLGQRAVGDRLVDAREVLLDDGARAEVQMADLAVAHLPVRQADRAAARDERRVRIARPEVVEHRGLGERDGVPRAVGGETPAVEDDEDRRGERVHGRSGPRGGRDDRRRRTPGRARRRPRARRRCPGARAARRRSPPSRSRRRARGRPRPRTSRGRPRARGRTRSPPAPARAPRPCPCRSPRSARRRS